jgi:allophanate hydrolase subunit 1
VAIGGIHAGIYSVGSPGGWHLLGRIEEVLFDLEAARHPNPDPAKVFLLQAGDQIKFEPIKTP